MKPLTYDTLESTKVNLSKLKNLFIKLGWRPDFEFINKYFYCESSLTYKEAIEFYTDNWFVYHDSLKRIFYNCGLNETVCKKLESILLPLKNTCYTTKQL